MIKVGSSSLSRADGRALLLSGLVLLVEEVCRLRSVGHRVVLVSSGAVACGCIRLGLSSRPTSLAGKQAVAAVGQSRLMRVYDDAFSSYGQAIAQVLLTRDNLSARPHYENALHTLHALLELGVVPIVNENDTVAVEELRVGDNDTLSALVASLIHADFLFLLTDVDGLYTADPRTHPHATRIPIIHNIDKIQEIVEQQQHQDAHRQQPLQEQAQHELQEQQHKQGKQQQQQRQRQQEKSPSQAGSSSGLSVAANGSGLSASGAPVVSTTLPLLSSPASVCSASASSSASPSVSVFPSSSPASLSSVGSRWGTGGMATKLQAARIATSAGVTVAIIKADKLEHISHILHGEVNHQLHSHTSLLTHLTHPHCLFVPIPFCSVVLVLSVWMCVSVCVCHVSAVWQSFSSFFPSSARS